MIIFNIVNVRYEINIIIFNIFIFTSFKLKLLEFNHFFIDFDHLILIVNDV